MARWGEIKCPRCALLEERLEAAQRDAKEAEEALAQQDDLVQAAVAAALREAAECCTAQLRNTAMLMSNPPQSSAAWDARNAILALITLDAQAALDRGVQAQQGESDDRPPSQR